MDKVFVGKIAGVPIAFSPLYVVLLLIWGQNGLTSGTLPMLIATLFILLGLTLSILLHELGHAFAASMFDIDTDHIELHGMGGTCFYGRGRVSNRSQEICLNLFGPLANLLIYALCEAAQSGLYQFFMSDDGEWRSAGLGWISYVIGTLGSANFALFWFNLMPAHPLDGGKIATVMLRGRTDDNTAKIAVGWMGIAVAALLLANRGIDDAFAVSIVLMLAYENASVIMDAGRPPWRRWN